jgi:Ca2+-binding RTX toxin-like protein
MTDFMFTAHASDDLRGSEKNDVFIAEASNLPAGFGTLSSSDRAFGGDGTDRIIIQANDILSAESVTSNWTRSDVVGFTLDAIEELEVRAYDSDGDTNNTNGEILLGMMNVTGLQKVTSSSSTADLILDYLNELIALDIKGNGLLGTDFTLNYTNEVSIRPPVIFSQPITLANFGDRGSPGGIKVDAVNGFSITTKGKASTIRLNGLLATTIDLNLSANLAVPESDLPALQFINGLADMTGAFSIGLPKTTKNLKITTGLGADSIETGAGADTISSGGGNDRILPGSGQDSVDMGAGNDIVQFSYIPRNRLSGLSLTDRIAGGDGIDRITFITGGTTELDIVDRFFRNWSGIEILDVAAARGSTGGAGSTASMLSLGTKAAAQGLQSVITGPGDDSIILSGFNQPLRIDLNDGIDQVDATKADRGKLEITIKDSFLDLSDVLLAGSGTDDKTNGDELRILVSGMTITLDKVTGFERITLEMADKQIGSTRTKPLSELILNNNSVARGRLLVVDASALQGTGNYAGLTLNGTAETDGRFEVTGSTGSDVLMVGDRDDVLKGSAGNDRFNGGKGSDTLTGGAGIDRYLFTQADLGVKNRDIITDFTLGEDFLLVSGLGGANQSTRISRLVLAGNEETTRAANTLIASGQVPNDGELSAVFVAGTETLWIDFNENGQLEPTDFQIELTGISELGFDDLMIG